MIEEILKRIIGDRDLTDDMLEDIKKLKDCYDEDDLNHQNAGMTIVLIGDLK